MAVCTIRGGGVFFSGRGFFGNLLKHLTRDLEGHEGLGFNSGKENEKLPYIKGLGLSTMYSPPCHMVILAIHITNLLTMSPWPSM